MIFAAALSRWILGRRLNMLHYMGCAAMHVAPCVPCRCTDAGVGWNNLRTAPRGVVAGELADMLALEPSLLMLHVVLM